MPKQAMKRTVVTIPAEVLSLLGNLQKDDPPVAWEQKCWSPVGVHWEEHCSPRAPRPSHSSEWDRYRIVLPASNAAIAAVVARHVGLDPSQGVTWAWDYDGGGRLFALHGEAESRWFAHDEGEHVVPTLAGVTDPTLAHAHVACWLARVVRVNRNLDANGLPQLETITAHGMGLFECEYNLPPLEPTP